MALQVRLLGTGTSSGVPVIGCSCAICRSTDPKNQRTRCSIAVINTANASEAILIDTAPELRLQLTRHEISKLCGVLYTHIHADHCHGFDDLRAFSFVSKQNVLCYLAAEMIPEFRQRFAYAFNDTGYNGIKPQVDLQPMPEKAFMLGGLAIEPVRLPHGAVQTTGFRFGKFAYVTDFKILPPDIIARWKGQIDTMVASGIHFGTHDSHSVIPETLALFEKLGVRRGILTHLAHNVDYVRDASLLPSYAEFGYDGLQLEV